MEEGEPEVTAVSVARREMPRHNAATGAAARRRALLKAVEYTEALLTRLRARLGEPPRAESSTDEEPQAKHPPAQPEAASPDSLDSARNDTSARDENGPSWVPSTPPSDQHSTPPSDQRAEGVEEWGKAASTLTAPAPVSEPPASEETPWPPTQPDDSGPSISPWLPRVVAEAQPRSPEPTPPRAMAPRPALSRATPPKPTPTAPKADRVSARPSISREPGRKRTMIVAAIASMVLLVALAVGALVLSRGGHAAAPVTQRTSLSSQAYALPVLRHNPPRPFSTVLTRLALVTRAPVASGARTSVATGSASPPSGTAGQ